jgi:hypothetical protein
MNCLGAECYDYANYNENSILQTNLSKSRVWMSENGVQFYIDLHSNATVQAICSSQHDYCAYAMFT